MTPRDPDEPLPTTPLGPTEPGPAGPTEGGPGQASGPRWDAPPPPPAVGPPPGWGGGWAGGPPWMPPPPPPPPRRDRLALGIVAFIFGGLFLVFFGFLVLAYTAVRGEAPGLSGGPKIGVVEIRGGIGVDGGADGDRILKQLHRFAQDDRVQAIVVRIDSPGGAVGESQELHDEVRRLAAKKTVVCSLGNLAASGGFYVAVACPKIVAAPGTLTGSIGVISQFPNVKGLMERFDVRFETVKSGKLKDAGNPFRDMTPEERAYWQALIDRAYGQFLAAVAEGRKLDVTKVREVADGRVITGAEAKERGLVDQLGNFYDAVELARSEAKLSGEPALIYPPEDRGRLLEHLVGGATGAVADAVAARIARGAAAAQEPGIYFLAR